MTVSVVIATALKPRRLLFAALAILAACSNDNPQPAATSVATKWPEVAAVCDGVAAAWQRTAMARVRVTDSVLDVIAASAPVLGCEVIANAPRGVDSLRARGLYWNEAGAPGWKLLAEFMADGPDGGSRTFERDGVLCEVQIQVDGHDDTDTTYVPKPWLIERTHCWRGEPRETGDQRPETRVSRLET